MVKQKVFKFKQLRVTECVYGEFLEFVKSRSKYYLVCNEMASKAHCQASLYTDYEDATFKKHVREKWGANKSGNKAWSYTAVLDNLVEIEGQEWPCENIGYYTKQESYDTNYPSIVLNMAIQLEQEKQAKHQEQKNKKKDKRTIRESIEDELIEQSYQDLESEHKHWCHKEGASKGHTWSKEQIVSLTVGYYKKQEKLVKKFDMVNNIQTLCLKYVPSYDHSLYLNLCELV